LGKRSQDILGRKPDKGYPDAGSMIKYYMGSHFNCGFPTKFYQLPAHALKTQKRMSEAN